MSQDIYQEIALAETSRLLGKHLAQCWLDVPFQRKTERYAGGCAMVLTWRDGPTEREVSAVTQQYHGREWDKKQGCDVARIETTHGPHPRRYQCDSIELLRSYSPGFLKAVIEAYTRCTYDLCPVVRRQADGRGSLTHCQTGPDAIEQIILQEALTISARELPTLGYRLWHRQRIERHPLLQKRDWSGGMYPELAVVVDRYYWYGPCIHHYIVPVVKRQGPHAVLVSMDFLSQVSGYLLPGYNEYAKCQTGRARAIEALPDAWEWYQQRAETRPPLIAQIREAQRHEREQRINAAYQ